eukprot:gnl/MRDRNA2_/MRDRNA2_18339_c0_seq2.p1 gnl/MRDRNA2_/MRDRNA2_18339_c0~~gnl/MRDRNA2_/MRDRNA2_18339_c0_seq2.p1  ORF type:complete len:300 (+),score=46.13 gnl/MRDRNA2_/MRDRNA2_18339_c0_seq2:187-1086(+)
MTVLKKGPGHRALVRSSMPGAIAPPSQIIGSTSKSCGQPNADLKTFVSKLGIASRSDQWLTSDRSSSVKLQVGRRSWLFAPLACALLCPQSSWAATKEVFDAEADVARLKLGIRQLSVLLDDWNNATLNCNYAEFNYIQDKDELIKISGESALFSKGSAVKTVCKRDSELVRSIMGVAGEKKSKSGPPAAMVTKGLYAALGQENAINDARPLKGIDAVIKRGLGFTDDPDLYVDAMERWSRAKSGFVAGSYSSGSNIASRVMAVEADDAPDQSLEASRRYCVAARDALSDIVRLLSPGT